MSYHPAMGNIFQSKPVGRKPRKARIGGAPRSAYQAFVASAHASGQYKNVPFADATRAIAAAWRASGQAAAPKVRKRASTAYNRYQSANKGSRAMPGRYEMSVHYESSKRVQSVRRRNERAAGGKGRSDWNDYVKAHMKDVMHLPPKARLGELSRMRKGAALSGGSIRRRRSTRGRSRRAW